MEILIVDIETVGFRTTDAIVEIGLVLVDTDKQTRKLLFNEVVKDAYFQKWKDYNAWIFTHSDLTVQDVLNATPLKEYLPEIQSYLDKYPVTAYNKAFDLRFLMHRGLKCNDIKCLMRSASKYTKIPRKNGKGYKYPKVEEAHKKLFPGETNYVEKHRAGDDAMDEARIMLRMCEIKKNQIII